MEDGCFTRKEILEKIIKSSKDSEVMISFNKDFDGNTVGFKTFNSHEDKVYGFIDWCGGCDGWAMSIDLMHYSNDCDAVVLDKIFEDIVDTTDSERILEANLELESVEKIEELFDNEEFFDYWYDNKIKIYCRIY